MGRNIFVSGGNGYPGTELVASLKSIGHQVIAPARVGNAIAAPTSIATHDLVKARIDTYVHILGGQSKFPWTSRRFSEADILELRCSTELARNAGVRHFIYVGITRPNLLRRYNTQLWSRCEEIVSKTGLATTTLRPWHLTGPGHRWPAFLRPLCWMARYFPRSSDVVGQLCVLSIDDLISALSWAVNNPPEIQRLLGTVGIRDLATRQKRPGSAAHSVRLRS